MSALDDAIRWEASYQVYLAYLAHHYRRDNRVSREIWCDYRAWCDAPDGGATQTTALLAARARQAERWLRRLRIEQEVVKRRATIAARRGERR